VTRRVVLSLITVALLGGVAGPALASTSDSGSQGTHRICVVLTNNPYDPNAGEGYCVWAPLPVSPGQ
jgi:hypothetical protein